MEIWRKLSIWRYTVNLTVKTWFTGQNEIETYKMCLFESQILFYQKARTAGVNAINAGPHH